MRALAKLWSGALFFALAFGAFGFLGSSMPHPTSIFPVQAAAFGPADWHPILAGGMGLGAGPMAYDASRDRILVTANPFDSQGLGLPAVLLVLDSSGQVIANSSSGGPGGWGASVSVDEASGFGYLSSIGPTLVHADTQTGAILDTWTYPFNVFTTTAHGGTLYAIAGDANGPLPMKRIDPTTGAVLGNVTGDPSVFLDRMLIDPSGRWLFGSRSGNTALQIDLTNGSVVDLGVFDAGFSFSADPSRVYLCGSGTSGSGLWSLWPANGTIAFHPNTQGLCAGAIAANPVTDVVATQGGFLLGPGPVLDTGRTRLGSSPGFVPALQWTPDGKELLAAVGLQDGGFEIGIWGGTPHLIPPEPDLPVLNPHYYSACAEIRTAAGMNLTDVEVYLDGGASPLIVGATDPFPCIDLPTIHPPDGDHVLRVTGWDLLGQHLDDSLPFVTDGSPPLLAFTSALATNVTPYVLRGSVNDAHPWTVIVNGRTAALVGAQWSIGLDLPIGNTSVVVTSVDVAGNEAVPLTGTVRYWPAVDLRVRNETAHFSVPVPPGWSATKAPLPGSAVEAITLIGPFEVPIPPQVLVVSMAVGNATSDPAYALFLAEQAQAFIVTQGATILERAHALRVANHSAAGFLAAVTIAGVPERYSQTVIVAAEWQRIVVVTGAFPEARWANHSEDVSWILEGMQIDPVPPSGGGWNLTLLVVGGTAAGAGVVAAVIGILLWRKRKPRAPAQDGGVPGPDLQDQDGQGEALKPGLSPSREDLPRRPP